MPHILPPTGLRPAVPSITPPRPDAIDTGFTQQDRRPASNASIDDLPQRDSRYKAMNTIRPDQVEEMRRHMFAAPSSRSGIGSALQHVEAAIGAALATVLKLQRQLLRWADTPSGAGGPHHDFKTAAALAALLRPIRDLERSLYGAQDPASQTLRTLCRSALRLSRPLMQALRQGGAVFVPTELKLLLKAIKTLKNALAAGARGHEPASFAATQSQRRNRPAANRDTAPSSHRPAGQGHAPIQAAAASQ